MASATEHRSISRNCTAVFVLAAVALGGVAASCGSTQQPTPIETNPTVPTGTVAPVEGGLPPNDAISRDSDGGDSSDGSRDASDDSSTDGKAEVGEGGIDPAAPIMTITSPLAVSDPNAGVVLTETSVKVVCTAQQSPAAGSQPVNESTVGFRLFDMGDASVEAGGTPTSNPGEYQTTLQLNGFSTGRVFLYCGATDRSTPPLAGSTTIQTFVDRGPLIDLTSPTADSPRALKQPVEFDFSVRPTPLGDPDLGSAVDSVTVLANGVDVTPPADGTGRFRFSVNFNDKLRFPQTPTGTVPVIITAKNRRKPTAAVKKLDYKFPLDGAGPVIDIIKPTQTTVVGGEVTLEFTVTDVPAGVNKSTISVEVGSEKYIFDPLSAIWSEKDGKYTFRFDSTSILATTAQVTVLIRANDTLGNVAEAKSVLLYLDNQPPYVDLDPPAVREMTKAGEKFECSDAFDPLGVAANDRSVVNTAALFRALVWDQTNAAPGQTILYYAKLDESSVSLYLQPDVTKPLLVDTNGDHVCDEIADDLRLSLMSVNLKAIPPAGSAYFGTDATSAPALNGCVLKVPPGQRPAQLCTPPVSDLTRVISHSMAENPAVIFGIGDLKGVACTGTSWEIGGKIAKEGWACLAARAVDVVGNVGVSAPLRVCYDDQDPSNGKPDCATPGTAAYENPPACTQTCQPRAAWSPGIIRRF